MKTFKEVLSEARGKPKSKDDEHDYWHIEAEHVGNARGVVKKHPETEYLGKDDTFDTVHHFIVNGSKKKAEEVRKTIWDDHNGGAHASLKPYREGD